MKLHISKRMLIILSMSLLLKAQATLLTQFFFMFSTYTLYFIFKIEIEMPEMNQRRGSFCNRKVASSSRV